MFMNSNKKNSKLFLISRDSETKHHSCTMSLMRCRRHTCKIIIVTSLVWCFLDMLILLSYSDCSNGVGFGCTSNDVGKKGAIKFSQKVNLDSHGREIEEYPRSKLRSWTAAKVVQKQRGSPGEMGKAVQIPADKEQEKKEKFKINQFNLLASEMISLNRSLQDVRLTQCKHKVYPSLLPTTSVVIVFHNEAWTTLLRTVHSIINRSPRELVEEVILVRTDIISSHLTTAHYLDSADVNVTANICMHLILSRSYCTNIFEPGHQRKAMHRLDRDH